MLSRPGSRRIMVVGASAGGVTWIPCTDERSDGIVTVPGYLDPMLATLARDPVVGPEWIVERKLDGIRMVAVGDGGQVRLFSRNHIDRSRTYPEIAVALRRQGVDRFVVDGEIVAFDGNRTSFERLQQRMGVDDPDAALAVGVDVRFYLFDVLHLDGHDTTGLPLRERKQVLRRVFDFDDPLWFCPHRNEIGPSSLADACAKGWEGLIAKRADSPYRSGRSRDWVKLKCVADQELVIGGWTDPKGGRHGFGSLLVGHFEDGALHFAGKVGTGFDDAQIDRLVDDLRALAVEPSPFVDPPRGRDLHWVRPELVAQVGFTEWTGGGKLRHPRFLGIRDDKVAGQVRRERPA